MGRFYDMSGNEISLADITNRSGQLIDPVLTQIARQYSPDGFVADAVCPRVTVMKESGKFPIWNSTDFFRSDVDLLRADRSSVKRVTTYVTTEPYLCEEYAVGVDISERERDNTDDILRLEENKVKLAMKRLALAREVRVATLLKKTGSTGQFLTSGAAPANNWNVDAGTIETDITTAKEAIWDLIGEEPNYLVIPYKVANAIAQQQDIREILKYTVDGRAILEQGYGILPDRMWGLKVLVVGVRQVTSADGAASETSGNVWGDDPRVLYVDSNATPDNPSVAYTLQTQGVETRRWYDAEHKLDVIECSEIVHEKCCAPDAGYEIQDVLS